MIVIEEVESVSRCTFMDALEPQVPAPVVGARQIINMHDDGRRFPVAMSPEEEVRLRREEQKIYRSRKLRLVAK